MALKRKNKVLATDVVKNCRKLEIMTYELIDKWKHKYKYTLIEAFRKHVENLRESTICALRTNKIYVNEKIKFYDLSLCSLDNIEYLLEIMCSPYFNIISYNQYADFAMIIDKVGEMVDRLMRSLTKTENNNNETPEFQNFDDERG